MAGFEQVQVNGRTMEVFTASPASAGAHPAVAVMHHRYGIDDFTKDVVARLAAKGYVAAAPNVFHRQPKDTPSENRRTLLRDSEVVADIAATIALLENRRNVQRGRLAILGHCMGGRMAFLGAASFPVFKAAVAYYSGNMRISWGNEGPTPFDKLGKIRCPVVGFFGNDDQNPTPADVDAIAAELDRHGIAHEFHRYDGAGHGFQNFTSRERYREEATRDSWARTIRFLRRHILEEGSS